MKNLFKLFLFPFRHGKSRTSQFNINENDLDKMNTKEEAMGGKEKRIIDVTNVNDTNKIKTISLNDEKEKHNDDDEHIDVINKDEDKDEDNDDKDDEHIDVINPIAYFQGDPTDLIHVLSKSEGNVTRAFISACYRFRLDIAKALFNSGGVDINSAEFEGILLYTAKYGHVELLKLLISAGVNVNDSEGHCFPLLSACCEGQFQSVKVLLEAGCDLNVAHKGKDKTSLSHALLQNNYDIADALISTPGLDVSKKSTFDGNYLHQACRRACNLELVKKLIKLGTDVNGTNFQNNTVLSVAQSYGHVEIVEVLKKEIAWLRRKPLLLMRPCVHTPSDSDEDEVLPTQLAILIMGESIESKKIRQMIGIYL